MYQRLSKWIGMATLALLVSLAIGHLATLDGGAISSRPALLAQETETPTEQPATSAPISGTFEDPQGNFQIGILEGVTTTSVGNAPLFQLPDGSLAYSVVRVPLGSETPLSDIALVELARQALDNGEGFQTQTFSSVPGGGLQIDWTGRLSQGAGPVQPLSGRILAKQQGDEVYLLVVAALESATAQVPAVLVTLSDTLTIL